LALLLGVISCKGGKDAVKSTPDDEYRITFHQAIQEKMRGNFDIAAELFEKCLELDPTSDASHFALSDLYERLGDQPRIMEHANRAFELDNSNKWYALRLAHLYFDMGNYHKSSEYFEKVIEDEKNLEVKFKYAESLIYSHKYEQAIDVLNDIEVETGKSPHLSLTKHDMYLEMGDEESAKNELNSLIADDPSNIENRLIIADYFLRTNQMEAAEKVATETVELAPDNGEVRLIIADIELRKGNLAACFDHLRKGFNQDDVALGRKLALIGSLQRYAFEDNDDAKVIESGVEDLYVIIYDEEAKNDTLHTQYGYFLQAQNKPEKAIEQFQKVVDINPDSYDSWIELLYAQYNADEYVGMLKNSKEAVELFPSQPPIFLLAGIAAYENKDFDSAAEWLYYGRDLVLQDMSLQSEFIHQIGKLSWLQKDYEQAHKYFDEAKVIDPYNGNIYRSKAYCYLEEGKEEAAFQEVESALDDAPINAFFLDLKGLLYFKIGKYEKAQKYIQNALVYEPANPDLIEHYGDVLFKLGEEEKAVKNWEQAERLGGYSKVLLKKIGERKYYESE
jgi:tetratricopeptide (TPR) repeat protein